MGSSEAFYPEVPDELDARLAEISESKGVKKAELISEALKSCQDRAEKVIFPEKS